MAAAKLTGSAKRLKAGEYEFKRGASTASIIGDIPPGRVVKHFVTVPRAGPARWPMTPSPRPTSSPAREVPPEGAVLPDTYQVQRGDDRAVVLQRMRAAATSSCAALDRAAQGLPFSTPRRR
jgi:UPF0755 protein